MGDPYAVLGVARDADGPAIHTAYRRAVRRTHPDAGGSAAEFEAVQEAYETLRDPARRRANDTRTAPPPRGPRRPPTPPPRGPRSAPAPPAAEPGFDGRGMEDLLADSRRLENEARRLAGLPPRDFSDSSAPATTGDSFAAILDDAQVQLRDTASAVAGELRRRLRRLL